MNESELPSWVVRIRDRYEADPTKWIGIGAAVLVLLLIGIFLGFTVKNQKAAATADFIKGANAVENREFQTSAQIFERIRTSQRFSGLVDEASVLHAASLFGLGDYEKAESVFREVVGSDAMLSPQAELGIGACMEMRGETEAALAHYENAKGRESFLKNAFDARIARLARAVGKREVAIEIYDRLEKDTDSLWKELARGNRRIVTAVEAVAAGTANVRDTE